MNTSRDITEYVVRTDTDKIAAAAFRKCKRLSIVTLPPGLLSIGDAAFSFCESLKQIRIPASVECIGVAAFCGSGLETVVFEGTPKEIESKAFHGCQHLKQIIVPKGCRAQLVARLGVAEELVVEGDGGPVTQVPSKLPVSKQPETVNLFGEKTVRRTQFHYNQQSFNWAVGDSVDLKTFFSGPTALVGNPAYLFRRKALFIFLKSSTSAALSQNKEYEIPANVKTFLFKYQEKFGSRSPRVFVFVCDDGKTARVYDEVEYLKVNVSGIIVKSLLRI